MAASRFAQQLNAQIGNELAAHHQYLACAIPYDALTMPRMAAFFYAQALEERGHAMMMVQYLLDTDHDVAIPAVEAPVSSFSRTSSPLVALALDQERRVTEQVNGLLRTAARGGRRLRAVHAVVHQGSRSRRSRRCPTSWPW